MRVLISADMEGATGVTWTDDCVAGTEPWQRMRRLFNGDVNACVAGLVADGATDVLVNESYSAQRNLQLDERARMLAGRHKPLSMMPGIDREPGEGPDAVVLGYHAIAGAQGVLAHTWLENAITQVRLDGAPVGEGGLNAAVAVVPSVTQPGPCTVAVEAESMTAAYRAFKIVATVAASAMQDVYG